MSAAVAAAAAAALHKRSYNNTTTSNRTHTLENTFGNNIYGYRERELSLPRPALPAASLGLVSRYESQKRRDWYTFQQYLRNHRPPLELSRCSGAHVLEFLRFLDQFGKTKVHNDSCPYFGLSTPTHPPAGGAPTCACPTRQAWGSLDALVGRLRAAFEENGGKPETNPFAARAVKLYLRDVRDSQAKARGIGYEKKKRTNNNKKVGLVVVVAPQQQELSGNGFFYS